MNLREKIKDVFDNFITDYEVKEIEQLIKREQIGFAEWKDKNCVRLNTIRSDNGLYITHLAPNKKLTLDQLLEIYKERDL